MYSDAIAHKFLDAIFNGTTFIALSNRYISYHSADPGTTGANEMAVTRQAMANFGAAASRTTDNSSSESTVMPTGTPTHIGIWDHLTNTAAVNFVWGLPIPEEDQVAFTSGESCGLAIGDLDFLL